jgi:Mg2+/Co2+ transporter CorB
MDSYMLITLAAIVGLLVLSGFFSGSETSLTAASRARMHTLAQQGDHRAALVNRLWRGKAQLIGAILLGNNLVNILGSALATSLMISLFGEAGVLYATLAMTLLVLIFAEVLPKTYALSHADNMALTVAPVMQVIVALLSPVVRMVQWIVTMTLRLFGLRIDAVYTADAWEEEMRGAIDMHKAADEESRHERAMLRSILDLGDVEVVDIMMHRSNVVTIDAELSPEQIVSAVLESPFTRLPLWRRSPENIVGVLHAKALLRAVEASGGRVENLDVLSIANDPWFIPESTDLLSQLQAFRARKEHFAIVVDEYGDLQGIVTLEDILEEIVGDIADEHDVEVEGVELQSDGSAVVEGSVTIRDLNRRCDWRLPDEEASTIAGLVLHEARRIPEAGQSFAFHGFRFEILERERHQVTLIKVTRLTPPGSETAAVSGRA